MTGFIGCPGAVAYQGPQASFPGATWNTRIVPLLYHKAWRKECPARQRRSAQIVCSFPKFNRPIQVDPTMMWGDALMITATELASERIPISEVGLLACVMLGAWLLVSMIKGDYRPRQTETVLVNVWLMDAMTASMFTWVLAVPAALAVYSAMAPSNIIDALVLSLPDDAPSNALPPQLEVMMADLVTLCCWRGVYAFFRM